MKELQFLNSKPLKKSHFKVKFYKLISNFLYTLNIFPNMVKKKLCNQTHVVIPLIRCTKMFFPGTEEHKQYVANE